MRRRSGRNWVYSPTQWGVGLPFVLNGLLESLQFLFMYIKLNNMETSFTNVRNDNIVRSNDHR